MRQLPCLLVVWVFMLALATANEQTVRTTPTTDGAEEQKVRTTPTTTVPTTPMRARDAECWYTSTLGRDYKGKVNSTWDGKQCQRWDRNYDPHPNPFVHSAFRFPESTVSQAENYCRNPDGEVGGPWCYTKDPDTRWSYCEPPQCAEPGPCASNWHRSPANTCWRYFDENLSYTAAKSKCREIGAELVTVGRRVDVIFLRGFRSTIGKDNTRVWIGGTFYGGQWRWDGLYTGIVEAFDWYPGEPSGSAWKDVLGRICLEGFDNNQWNDEDCWSLRPYICERA